MFYAHISMGFNSRDGEYIIPIPNSTFERTTTLSKLTGINSNDVVVC
jgi:hypothetical protein